MDSAGESWLKDVAPGDARIPVLVRRCAALTHVAEVNNAFLKLCGVSSKEELLEVGPRLLSDNQGIFESIFLAAARGKTSSGAELSVRDAGGELRFVDLQWSVLPGSGKAYSAVLVSVVDLTEHKWLEEELKRHSGTLESLVGQLASLNEESESFVSAVAHDLRTPLTVIDGYTFILEKSYVGRLDADGRDAVHQIRETTQKMKHLVDDLLTLSRVGRAEMQPVAFDLSSMARTVLLEALETAPERNVEMVVKPNVRVEGDPRLLNIALTNLFSNSLKFTSKHPNSRIEFGSFEEGKEVVCYVKDDGAGFDQAAAKRLFTPFQRLHRDEDFPGTGVGLVTVRRIISRHGGRVWAEGKVEGGATIYFTLPAGRPQGDDPSGRPQS
jgi:signal transduction histidine kinase